MLIGLLLIVSACSKPSTPTKAYEAIPAQGSNEVWVKNREFRPDTITVPAGTKVTWINKSGEDMHTVKSDDGLFAAILLEGRYFSFTFTERGTFSYYCDTWPEMGGKVIVE